MSASFSQPELLHPRISPDERPARARIYPIHGTKRSLEPTEPDLETRFREGDPHAFSEIYRLYRFRINRFIAKRTRDPGEAEDLTQETFMQAFRSHSNFESRSTILTWLMGIARFVCFSFHRFSTRWMIGAQAVDYDYEPTIAARAEDDFDAALTLARCIDRLLERRPERDVRIFALRYGSGMKVREIAAVCGESVDIVKSSLRRSREMMKPGVEAFFRDH